jgi:hypothetical protein
MAASRIRPSPFVLIGLAAVATAILAIAFATALGGHSGVAATAGAQAGGVRAGPAAAAAGPPPGCSSAAITPRHGRITVEQFDRRVWCERYHATPNSSIYQFVGVP